jgi:hypothetical protein
MPSCACIRSFLASSLFIFAATSNAQTARTEERVPEPSILPADQMALIEAKYPNHAVRGACQGNFTGNSEKETVIVLRSKSDQKTDKDIRAAVVYEKNKPTIHSIDEELTKDLKISSSVPLTWIGATDGTVKCNANPIADPQMSDHGKLLGHRPFFNLPVSKGSGRASSVCYATSHEYNNWDCVAYDRKQRRFRLWYQQSLAD